MSTSDFIAGMAALQAEADRLHQETLNRWIDVRDYEGRLLFRYNPGRKLIEIQRRKKKMLFELDQLEKEDKFYRVNDPSHSNLDLIHNTPQSATSAAQQEGGAYGRCTHE